MEWPTWAKRLFWRREPQPAAEPVRDRPQTFFIKIGGKSYLARPTGVQGPMMMCELLGDDRTAAGQALVRAGQAENPDEYWRQWRRLGGDRQNIQAAED